MVFFLEHAEKYSLFMRRRIFLQYKLFLNCKKQTNKKRRYRDMIAAFYGSARQNASKIQMLLRFLPANKTKVKISGENDQLDG